MSPGNADVWWRQYRLEKATQNDAAAASAAREVLRIDPQHAHARMVLGFHEYQAGLPKEIWSDRLSSASRAAPEHPDLIPAARQARVLAHPLMAPAQLGTASNRRVRLAIFIPLAFVVAIATHLNLFISFGAVTLVWVAYVLGVEACLSFYYRRRAR